VGWSLGRVSYVWVSRQSVPKFRSCGFKNPPSHWQDTSLRSLRLSVYNSLYAVAISYRASSECVIHNDRQVAPLVYKAQTPLLRFVVPTIDSSPRLCSDDVVCCAFITTWRILWTNMLNFYAELSQCCRKQNSEYGWKFTHFVSHICRPTAFRSRCL